LVRAFSVVNIHFMRAREALLGAAGGYCRKRNGEAAGRSGASDIAGPGG
jgi:hypothetical protein